MDWSLLKNLRQVFLSENKNTTPYWSSRLLLEQYDETFAARIGWKWDSVLKENKSKLSLPENYTLIDWGAGTAVASRKFLSLFTVNPKEVILVEKSELAQKFSKEKIKELNADANIVTSSKISSVPENSVLLVSHVMTELDEKGLNELIQIAEKCHTIIWVEPGTFDCSKHLSKVREKLLPDFTILSPCTHRSACPILGKENTTNWCHHFAKVPSEAFTTAKWKSFSKELGIDLRSLPTSYLVMSKTSGTFGPSLNRVIGRSRNYKGYSMAQVCNENGLMEWKVLEKNSKKTIKELKEGPFSYWVD